MSSEDASRLYTVRMNDIVVGDLTFIPSKQAAQVSGYAQDYIGQLCRAGLIQAQRIGGLWYVNLDSLYKHKQKADSYVPVAPRKAPAPETESLITFEGKDYISAVRAAELTGYHKDYVGQLAREGPILSRQVGNRWFVERESILNHKRTKDSQLAAVQTKAVGLAKPEGLQNTSYSGRTVVKNSLSTAPQVAAARSIKSEIVAQPEQLQNTSYSDHTLMTYTTENGDLIPMAEHGTAHTANTLPKITPQYPSVEPRDTVQRPARDSALDLAKHSTVIRPAFVRATPSRGSNPHLAKPRKRGISTSRMGLLTASVATVVIFLAFGTTTLSQNAHFTFKNGAAHDRMSALAGSTGELLEQMAVYLEEHVVPEVVYTRSN